MQMWRNFKQGISNLIYFFKVIWNDRDWDWTFLLLIMSKKLRKMSKYQKEHGISVNHKEYAKELMIAAELCRRLSGEHDYDQYYRERHAEKWGQLDFTSEKCEEYGSLGLSRMKFRYPNAKTDYEYRKASEESLEIARYEEERIKFEIDYLFTLMKRKLRTWWD